jgi:hypothetical protein
VKRIRNDALGYTLQHPGYGFAGDPLRPVRGQYYGPLVNAGIY